MTVYLGNYVVANDNGAAYTRQRDEIQNVIKTFGPDHITGITVGNEFMLNYLTANGATDPNGPVGNQGAALLKANIDDTRTMITGMNLNKHLTIGTADAGAFFNTLVLQDVEFGVCAFVHFNSYLCLLIRALNLDVKRPSLVCECLHCERSRLDRTVFQNLQFRTRRGAQQHS